MNFLALELNFSRCNLFIATGCFIYFIHSFFFWRINEELSIPIITRRKWTNLIAVKWIASFNRRWPHEASGINIEYVYFFCSNEQQSFRRKLTADQISFQLY